MAQAEGLAWALHVLYLAAQDARRAGAARASFAQVGQVVIGGLGSVEQALPGVACKAAAAAAGLLHRHPECHDLHGWAALHAGACNCCAGAA